MRKYINLIFLIIGLGISSFAKSFSTDVAVNPNNIKIHPAHNTASLRKPVPKVPIKSRAPVVANIIQSNTTICKGSSLTLSVDTTGFSNASNTLPANLQSGLVAYYPFNGNANDESGNGLNGILGTSGPTLASDRKNNSSSSYYFDGNDGSEKGIKLPVGLGSGDYSINLFFQITDTLKNAAPIFIIEDAAHTNTGVSFNHPFAPNKFMSCTPEFCAPNNPNSWNLDNKLAWHSLTFTKTATNYYYYVDGVLKRTQPITSATSSIQFDYLYIGAIDWASGEVFKGKIDDITVYNRALSPTEAQQLANPQPQILWSTGATTPSITVNPTATTTYTVTLTDGGVSTTDSVKVTVETPSATITPSGSTTILQGQSVNLSANAGASYVWSTGATTRTINVTTAGTYTVTVTTANSCSATSQPTSVTLVLKANIVQSNTTICAGSPITLSVDTTGFTRNVSSATLPANLQNSLVAYYPFNSNANDESGNGNHGAIMGGVTPTTDRFGNANAAYTFNGTNGHISIPSLNNMTYKPITYSGWVVITSNLPNTGGYNKKVILGRDQINVTTEGAIVFANNGTGAGSPMQNQFQYYMGGVPTPDNPHSNTNLPLGTWQHFVYTHDASGTFKWYINGVLTNSGTFTNINNANIPFNIGSGDGRDFWDNKIDDIAIYNRALSATEVEQLSSPQPQILWSTGDTTKSITVNPTATTTYYVTLTDGGVSSTDSVKVTVDTPIATITPSGPTALCTGGTVTLSANSGASYVWSTGATTPSITVSTAGSYTVTVTNATGCSATSVATAVTVNPLPTASITASGPTSFCAGGSVTLSANAASSYLWSNGATTQSITVSTAGAYTVRVTNATGCISVASAASTVVVNPLPTATITPSGPTALCTGGSVTLSANTGASYIWSTGATTQSITVTTAGSYTVTVTNATGCSATSVATAVTVNPLPIASITASGPTTFCAGGSVTLTANAASSYLWSNGATTQSITASAAGAYTVRITNATGCTSVASAASTVVVNALPTASITASGPTTFCAGGSVTLSANTASSYVWSNGATTQSITVSTAGAYTVRVTNATGCTSVASAASTVVVNALPTASITASGPTTFCAGGSVTLSANAGASYVWSNGATTQSITVSTAGSYTVRVTNATGCISTSSSAVSVSVSGALNIPNTFTPNGDGVNDTWVIDQINQYPNCTVTVFNKMGNKVFESVGYTQAWQGKFKDNDLPFDVYYYVIDVKCGSLLKGWIALIK